MTDASPTDIDDDSERPLLATTPPRRREVRRDEDGAVAPTLLGVRAREETHTPPRRTLARTVTLNMGDVDASAELDSDFGFQSRRGGALASVQLRVAKRFESSTSLGPVCLLRPSAQQASATSGPKANRGVE